jgi:hypothetical protein
MAESLREPLEDDDSRVLGRAVMKIQERGWGIAVGFLFGLGLFVATIVLVLKGGEVIGPHLGLLGGYLPGYRVSYAGSLIGFVYAFVVGYGCGWSIAAIYNRLTSGMR